MHHAAGLRRLLSGEREPFVAGVESGQVVLATSRESALIAFAERLTLHPGAMAAKDLQALRSAGLVDRELHDVVQVAAYFAYANRIVLGLGAELGVGEGPAGL